jgi:hypothetical protein
VSIIIGPVAKNSANGRHSSISTVSDRGYVSHFSLIRIYREISRFGTNEAHSAGSSLLGTQVATRTTEPLVTEQYVCHV